MGCISSKEITRSMSIRDFQSRSAAWEELLTSHSANDQLLAFVCSSNSNIDNTTKLTFTLPSTDPATNKYACEETALGQLDSCKFTRSKSCHTPRDKEMVSADLRDGKRSLSFHTVEEYDALLERIRLEDVELRGEDENERSAGWKRKGIARGLKSLDIEFPAIEAKRMNEHYVTPKFGTYKAPTITMPQNETQQNTVFSPELLAAFEDCMHQLQLEEEIILRHMDEVANPSIDL